MSTEDLPSVSLLSASGASPFAILTTTLLSARTRDAVTLPAGIRLNTTYPDAKNLACAELQKVIDLIRPVAFFKQKALNLITLARMLLSEFGGIVPDTLSDLTRLPGVGPKTANLVLGLAFGKPAICVDVHVNRIAYRIGWTKDIGTDTRLPDVLKTETKLSELFPKTMWVTINTVLVRFGQLICQPRNPKCDRCPLKDRSDNKCPRLGLPFM